MNLARRQFLALGTGTALAAATASPAGAASTTSYRWRNVEIVGGGFVTGIIHHPGKRGLVYARTDIGGAARFDTRTQRWAQLLHWIGWDEWNSKGVESEAIAGDPRVYGRVYISTNGFGIPYGEPV